MSRRGASESSRGVALAPPHGPSRLPAAIYLRASTARQSTENQRPDVERVLRARGLELVKTFEEHASTAKARPAFAALLDAARRGEFSVLVIWSVDRFGRSMVGNLQSVMELDRFGVQVISVQESWLDTGGPVRSLLLSIVSWIAEQERGRIGERTRAGLERAKARGIPIGRPRRELDERTLQRARELVDGQGLSVRRVAKTLRVPVTTLRRALELDDEPVKED